MPHPSASGPGIKGIAVVAVMAREISRQAAMPAFDDLLWLIGWITLAILPLLFIVKMSRTKAIVIA